MRTPERKAADGYAGKFLDEKNRRRSTSLTRKKRHEKIPEYAKIKQKKGHKTWGKRGDGPVSDDHSWSFTRSGCPALVGTTIGENRITRGLLEAEKERGPHGKRNCNQLPSEKVRLGGKRSQLHSIPLQLRGRGKHRKKKEKKERGDGGV